MARTIPTDYRERTLVSGLPLGEIRTAVQEWYEEDLRNMDKTGDMDTYAWYEGMVEAYENVLRLITVDPDPPKPPKQKEK